MLPLGPWKCQLGGGSGLDDGVVVGNPVPLPLVYVDARSVSLGPVPFSPLPPPPPLPVVMGQGILGRNPFPPPLLPLIPILLVQAMDLPPALPPHPPPILLIMGHIDPRVIIGPPLGDMELVLPWFGPQVVSQLPLQSPFPHLPPNSPFIHPLLLHPPPPLPLPKGPSIPLLPPPPPG